MVSVPKMQAAVRFLKLHSFAFYVGPSYFQPHQGSIFSKEAQAKRPRS